MTQDEIQVLTDMLDQIGKLNTALREHQRFTAGLFGMVFGILKQVEGAPPLTEIMEMTGDLLPDSTLGANAEILATVQRIALAIGRGH